MHTRIRVRNCPLITCVFGLSKSVQSAQVIFGHFLRADGVISVAETPSALFIKSRNYNNKGDESL